MVELSKYRYSFDFMVLVLCHPNIREFPTLLSFREILQ